MGQLVMQEFVSTDGFAANDDNEFDLLEGMEGDSGEFDRQNLAWLERVGAIVLGANTYRVFAGYWPTPQADQELIGPRINELPKYVFSGSLAAAPWGHYEPARVESGGVQRAA
jgi:hypothetical protein